MYVLSGSNGCGLSVAAHCLTVHPVNDFDLGYIMGLVVGEGSFTGDRVQPCLSIALHARDPEPLVLCQRLLGGRMYGPYWHGRRNGRRWLLRGYELAEAVRLFRAHLPPSHKRGQFLAWCE